MGCVATVASVRRVLVGPFVTQNTGIAPGTARKEKPMRTQRNVTGIAVWLAFLSWMCLVAGMVSPSEVVAQNKVPWYVAQRIASAKMWEISSIIEEATALNRSASGEIVEQSIKVRTEALDTILNAALKAAPEAASKITAGAMRAMSELQALEPPGTQPGTQSRQQTVSASVDDEELNYQLFPDDFDPFEFITNPDAAEEFTESILTGIEELLQSIVSPAL